MVQGTQSQAKGLEDELRNMILSNVSIPAGQTNQNTQSSQPQRGRGRGRGRGGFPPGGRGHDLRGGHHQNPNPRGSGTGTSAFRGGRGYSNNNVDARHRQPQVNPHAQAGSDMSQNGNTTHAGRQYPPRPPRQGHNLSAGTVPNTYAPPVQPQKVLQRPFNANMPGQGQANANGPYHPRQQQPRENPMMQVEHLDRLAGQEIPKIEMSKSEHDEKEAFRKQIEAILQQAFADGYSGDIATISLVCFGSVASGFGMPGSDMDLAVVPGWKDSSKANQIGIDRGVPRLLERAVLDAKMGGRLLTRTRVPILKVCQSPTDELYNALVEERAKWDQLPEEERYPAQLLLQEPPQQSTQQPKVAVDVNGEKPVEPKEYVANPESKADSGPTEESDSKTTANNEQSKVPLQATPLQATPSQATPTAPNGTNGNGVNNAASNTQNHRGERAWAREKVIGPLDFPKSGVGFQVDINFENPLGIHNTHLLRCYSLCDPRVRPIVLFVKSWAKTRKINSSYSGTLSSYGWVLMVLHYLVNVAQPPVCPNLQHNLPLPADATALEKFFKDSQIGEYTVRFWRDEPAITQAARSGHLTHNRQTVGALLRGFFQYYASVPNYGYGARTPQFYWTTEVLSLRTLGGIQTKQSKGWVSAKTIHTAEKKVTNRYLFAIEDPFELEHNVARTVTHRGIVAIRDEFRRAWRILSAIGKGLQPEGGIIDEVVDEVDPPKPMPAVDEAVTRQKIAALVDVPAGSGDRNTENVQQSAV